MAVNPQSKELKSFNDGLFGCFNDCGSCLISCCIGPCIVYGQNVEKLGTGSFLGGCLLYWCCCCLACFFAGSTRGQLRQKYGLKEEPCSDCCVHFWCSPCAVCQEYRAMK